MGENQAISGIEKNSKAERSADVQAVTEDKLNTSSRGSSKAAA
jgi:hypothetical protein